MTGSDIPHASAGRREALTGRIADALLETGAAQIPLRDLAARLGTSDRMLLYYFDDKAELVACSLREVSARLSALLATALPDRRLAPAEMLRAVLGVLASDRLAPFMCVWADVSARGARGEEPFETFSRRSVEGWRSWIGERLELADEADRAKVALAILTVAEGARLMGLSSSKELDDLAVAMSRGLYSFASEAAAPPEPSPMSASGAQ